MDGSSNASTDDGELAERLADAIARVTWSARAGGYQPPGLSLIAWAVPPAAALRVIAAHPDPGMRAGGLAVLDERARAGEGSAAAVRREVIATMRAAKATTICQVLFRAPLEDGRVQMAAVTALNKLKHQPLVVAAGRALLAHRLQELADGDAAEHAQVAEALWRTHWRDDYAPYHEALAPYCLGMARWYLAAGDAAKAGALLDQVVQVGLVALSVEPWREPVSDTLAAAGRQDSALGAYGVPALCAEARQAAHSDPAAAGALLDRARAATSPEMLLEQYMEGLITEAERAWVPQDLAWTAWCVGRKEEALAELSAIDREIRAEVRGIVPRAPGEVDEGAARDPFERARVRREELPALRASLEEELRRYRRRSIRLILRLSAALARTAEAALGRELLEEATAALRRRDPDDEIGISLADRELAPALVAHGQLDLAAKVLHRNRETSWHAPLSAALVGALQATGREEEARRVLGAAVEALEDRRGAMELVPAAGALLGAVAADRLRRAIEAADARLEESALPGDGG